MKKRSVVFGIVAFLLLVISVYVSFAESCNDKYNACIGQCGGGSSCNSQCYNEMRACNAAVWNKNGACVDACPRDDNYQPCQQNCIQMAIQEDKEVCRPKYDECVANCNNAQACFDSCESNKENCVEETVEEEPVEEEEEEIPVETPEETPEELPPEEDITQPEPEDSSSLIESVATTGMSENELRNYYEDKLGRAVKEVQNLLKDRAQEKFVETSNLRWNTQGAIYDYKEAQKKGDSPEELAKLRNDYDEVAKDLKPKLQDALSYDSGNVAALWELGALSRFEGDNKQSYEYFRDALASEQTRDPIGYQRRLDSINDPAMRMLLMQDLAPNENIINIPTTETSPFLKWFDENTKKPIQQVNKAKRQIAEQIEKIANAFSLSNYLPEKLEDINGQ